MQNRIYKFNDNSQNIFNVDQIKRTIYEELQETVCKWNDKLNGVTQETKLII